MTKMIKKKLRRSRPAWRGGAVTRLSPGEQDAMRAAGAFAGELLDQVTKIMRPGVSTGELDNLVETLTHERGATSAPHGYRNHGAPPFPSHCCTSVNDVVCHGIPDKARVLRDGDIVNVDVTPILDGFHGDTSRTFLLGENVSQKARQLVADARRALWLGIFAVAPEGRTSAIGSAIQDFAEARGYGVVREFTGHGTGRAFHTAPTIFHYRTPGRGERITPGMAFTIEPMINLGHWKTEVLADGWTAVTADGSLSAQWEHTLLVTEEGVEVLTLGQKEAPPPL